MRFTLQVLFSLLAGLLLGALIATFPHPALTWIPGFVEPVGTLYINAIRVCVIPLIMSGLIAGVGSAGGPSQVRSLGIRALFWMLAFLTTSVAFAGAIALSLFSGISSDARALDSRQPLPAAPGLTKWAVDLVPSNIVAALNDGSLLPLVVFSLAFGLALSKVDPPRREPVLQLLRGIADAFLALIGFAIRLAPVGIFALALPLAARSGLAVAGTLAWYVVSMSAIHCGFLLLIALPAALVFGRISLARFSKAASAAQAIAFTSRSSMAALPLASAAAGKLGLSEQKCHFFLPLAASIFRVGGAMQQVVGVLFLARLSGVSLTGVQLAALGLTSIATSFTIPGVPGGSILVMSPALASAGVPAGGLGLLLAVDAIPDMFRTLMNVTGWLSVSAILAPAPRSAGDRESVAV